MVPLAWELVSLLGSGGIGSFLPTILVTHLPRYKLGGHMLFHQLLGFCMCS